MARTKKQQARIIRIIGTVGDHGIRIFKEEREPERARQEANTVANFLEGGPPDFLMEAMLNTLGAAFDHFGLPKPMSAIGEGVGEYDAQNLQPLFLKTNC